MRFSNSVRFLLVLLVWVLPLIAWAGDPVIFGTTTFIAREDYHPLDGVQVTVYRKAPAGIATSHDGGKFDVQFAAGPPVYVLFEGPEGHIPQLQSLGAAAGMKHEVHVTLFTIEEAKRQEINIFAYIRAIVEQLQAVGVPKNSETLQRLRTLMNKFG